MKVLLIEDEPEPAQSIVEYLSGEDYLCEHAATYSDAVERIALYDYDCILLDLMLPDGDGLSVLKALKKENKQTGVIIISAKDSPDDRIKGIHIGADDYLPKPFHLPELGARIYALIRRAQYSSNNIIRFVRMNGNTGGNGLGLAIARQICALYGWGIGYEYENGRHRFEMMFFAVQKML